ncbi:MAG: hypothetical protein A2268_13825 [Candidatus Raymondbacteria bacterium RifOxyA12_full_50_37]|uniref:Outer membrane protein beta-barrel domain-containing protein n=1 Tax=Candidatus Raymondbacteria bacterium RIFOXYD12_FULL_49_13 TaxID=1817890 RepID=A0A1F7F4W9_UNCRA|nr:MAG: hypothetical protein A2248_00755 [Candidatus Raymondbacteria bacterium RIFOXYA2_FULL_49_16]OGJ91921.1 MAG: hypothetical protein A2268_13825 [Candidatus Raymondbacteria bacterium RifOxyA12_full_50_37]OGJ92836.1 MAG: hypothetical protein A2487_09695 [Candidatus Raymondbacteria bacterium RifOxyC12_full_50_8]OGJ95467.1 MAG: hypothetical protein A2453_05260 [Candidatus Raymondbacteria bacterium RIFOXYC2_FULL_50_21]OGK01623.1 MAG: hypothetical protein A2519_07265 [Candidatus Raymondbacteria b
MKAFACIFLLALPVWTALRYDGLSVHASVYDSSRFVGSKVESGLLPNQLYVSFEYGYSQMIDDDADSLSPFYENLNDQLANASNFILSVSGYIHGHIGIGLFYSRFISHAKVNVYAVSIGQKTFSGPYTEKLSVNYFGPVFGIRSSVWNKYLVFAADLRPGLVLFFDDISYANVINNFSSPVFGIGGSLGMEYLLKNNFGIIANLNGLFATIRDVKDMNGRSRRAERNISRADINLGIRLHLARRPVP